MSGWDALKVLLTEIHDNRSNALRSYPDPNADEGRTPPFHISLAAWADDIAAMLDEHFWFLIPAGGSLSVLFLIGTSSLDATLGYAIPPGQWAIDEVLELEDRGRVRTVPMPITVSDR
jgi:hypothetical protein